MERKPPKIPTGMMQPTKPMVSRRRADMQTGMQAGMQAGMTLPSKPVVSRRKPAMPEAPVAAPMGVRKQRKPVGNPMNPMMGTGKPKRGMY